MRAICRPPSGKNDHAAQHGRRVRRTSSALRPALLYNPVSEDNGMTFFHRALTLGFGVFSTCLLSACYVPRQDTFEESVRQQIQVNMPVTAAVTNLAKLKFNCHRLGPELDCTRDRNSLLISCLERVVLKPSEPDALLTDIEIRKIACFGGFG
jgi:hypothetical protein